VASEIIAQREQLENLCADRQIQLNKIEHRCTRYQTELSAAEAACRELLRRHPWMEAERYQFNNPGTEYDFDKRRPSALQKELVSKTARLEALSKRVNKKVLTMLETAEQEYADLMSKKDIVEKDKEKIEAVISELAQKKVEALQKTWAKVNADFGSIFATLLPGAQAKLEPQEGCPIEEGLVVKVGFGNVWKQSLLELSGGQRSLIALSLVLSLLRFKPAPVYILDEVDAALDLSHTQNIGKMIKAHFKQSQFLVVSLKEGMFNNANVIFRTKFVDNVSCVTRTVPNSRATAEQGDTGGKESSVMDGRTALPLATKN
jgi:structural maintenance of chromosome 2